MNFRQKEFSIEQQLSRKNETDLHDSLMIKNRTAHNVNVYCRGPIMWFKASIFLY